MNLFTIILIILLNCSSLYPASQISSFLLQSPSQPEPEKVWKEFTSEEGGFSVRVPGTLEKLVAPLETRAGQLPQYAYVLESPTAAYVISYVLFPYPMPSDPTVQIKMLDAGRDRMLAKDKTLKLISEANISPNGIPGREWLTEDEFDISRGRALLFNGRLYIALFSMQKSRALKPKSSATSPKNLTELFARDSEQFLSSLRLTLGGATLGEVDRLLRTLKEQGTELVTAISPNNSTQTTSPPAILNGRAVRLVAPQYPAIARRAHASGQVLVQVVIDLEGNIAAAQVVDGHPLLSVAAIKAARESQFTPTQLNGKPVMVAGVIVYNFVAQ